jgi:hypothetical protein
MNTGKAAKAESQSGVTGQPPKEVTNTQQRFGEAQRLRAGVGRQANHAKQDRWWIPELILWVIGHHSNHNYPTLLREELTKQSCS